MGPLRTIVVALLAVTLFAGLLGQQPRSKRFSPLAQRFQDKLDFLERNSHSQPVQRRSTQLNADEANAWFREGGYKLPQGVKRVIFHGQPDNIIANTTVDFDEVKEGKRNLNPLLSVFSGVHDVEIRAAASAQNGQGHVTIQSVAIDDIGVPHLALEMFVKRYITPKYPDVGLDNSFQMPDRIDTATIGHETALLTQR
ncbi:MAG TPA: hypothetical protein VG498_17765 [Terriglobales bacterium]|nr:hypothetical protein [Terriglobales bacterium]